MYRAVLCVVLMSLHLAHSLKCVPDACKAVRCAQPECGSGELKAPGGHCLCCEVCKKVVGENADCSADTPIAGPISDKVICEDGLICHGGICQKAEAVLPSETR